MMRASAPAAFALAVAGLVVSAHAEGETRSLTFYNIHTKETKSITYKRDGKFDPEGMKQINHMMRDWRRDEPTKMDPELIDTIWEIYQDVGSKEPIHLISGYRSKKTNNMLRRRGGGQAKYSRHILGKAADIHLPDVDVKKLRNSALVKQVGGVGYYPKSGIPFVHVDTGRVRHWPRIGRQELAMLFPDGKTKHIPRDGRPLTPKDSRIAMAKLDKKIDAFIEKKSKVKLPPKMMMASFAPSSLKWGKASPEVTGSITPARPEPLRRGEGPRNEPPPLPDDKEITAREKPKPPVEARTATVVPAPVPRHKPKPVTVKAPAPRPEITVATLGEAEHPEELVYGVHSVLPLMAETGVMSDRHLARLEAPGADTDGYLLREPEGGYSASLARGLGYTQELKLVTFGTTRRRQAEAPAKPAKPIRTASR